MRVNLLIFLLLSLLLDCSRCQMISQCSDLLGIQNNLLASYFLTNSFDCSQTTLSPIGNASCPFRGVFNGQGFTISNVTINSATNNTALFSFGCGATVSNMIFDNFNVRGQMNTALLFGNATSVKIMNVTLTSSTGTSSVFGAG